MTVIDAHHHLWDPQLREYGWMAPFPALDRPLVEADLREAVAGTPVTGTIVVTAEASDEETDWLLEIAESSELILGVVGWADLTDERVGDRLARLSERGGMLRGIRHPVHDEADQDWLRRPDVRRGLAAVQDAGLAYDLLIRRAESAAALDTVCALPELRFVVDHVAKPGIAEGEWNVWHSDLAALAAQENVYCKISGLVTEASWTDWREQGIERYVEETLELFGAERCMFGSDWPVCLLAASYAEVVELAQEATNALSAAERDAVFRGTAATVYGLG